MHHRRSQGDSKSTSGIASTSSSMPINNTNNSSSTGRVSIYSMRERVILNKMTQMMGKLAPDTETEVTGRLHQEIPAIRLDGPLMYSLYMTLQNLIHLHTVYILLYHSVFWFDCNKSHLEIMKSSRILEQTKYEQTHFLTLSTEYYSMIQKSINTNLINQYIYFSLLGISSIELFTVFCWTLRKKLPYLIPRHQKYKHRLNKILLGMIIFVNFIFILWLLIHTFLTRQLSFTYFSLIFGHLVLLTLIDKPNLFRQSSDNSIPRKQYRHSTSSSSTTSSIMTTVFHRLSYRSSTSNQPRKINPIVPSTTIIAWSRWSSVAEEKLEIHECSTLYGQARQEADDIWPSVIRRIILTIYRTLASFILFNLIPIKTMNLHSRAKETQPLKFLFIIFTLSTFISHSAFLFPVKLQTTLHRIATHLGQWRQQSNIRTDTIPEWSSECHSYTRGSVVKFSSTNQHYIAIQHLNNAAHPQSRSHSILSRLFGDPTYLLTIEFLLCFLLMLLQIIWIVRGKSWEQILVGCFIILHSSYPIFKIVRDRVILDLVDEHEIFQTSTISKQKKSS